MSAFVFVLVDTDSWTCRCTWYKSASYTTVTHSSQTNPDNCWLWQHTVLPCVHSKHPAELLGQWRTAPLLEQCLNEASTTHTSPADRSSQHPSPGPRTSTQQLQHQHITYYDSPISYHCTACTICLQMKQRTVFEMCWSIRKTELTLLCQENI